MPRYIDADELPKVKFHDLPYTHIYPADLIGLQTEAYERGWNDAIDAIVENAETADVVEVVRCKDCKWFPKCDEDEIKTAIRFRCKQMNMFYSPNHFCAFGERKE